MRILYCSVFGVGNAVDKIPSLLLLKEVFPYDEITILQDVRGKYVFEFGDFFDELIYFSDGGSKVYGILDIYDLVISAVPSNAWLDFVRSSCKGEIRGVFREKSQNQVPDWKYNYDMIKSFVRAECEIPDVYFPLFPEGFSYLKTSEEARRLQNSINYWITQQEKIIGIHTGGSPDWPWKRIPESEWDRIFAALLDDGYSILLLGRPSDILLGSWNLQPVLSKYEGSRFKIGLSSVFDLKTVAEFISLVDGFVSGDSGLMHVAAAVGVPTVGIFGPTSSIKNRPYSRKFKPIIPGVECHPCQFDFQKMKQCRDRRCMTKIDVESIRNFLKKFEKI